MSKMKFLSPYGPKKTGANKFSPDMDVTDQRAPVNEISELWQQYMVSEDLMEELDEETVSDFDEDVYPYDDISEFGEDVLTAAQPEVAAAGRRLVSRKKSNRAS